MSSRSRPLIRAALAILFSISTCALGDNNGLKPYEMNHRASASSPADVSFLLDAPAGKDGFIRVQDGHLAKSSGERIRFWGVHLTDWSKGSVLLPPKEDIPMWASTLARFGVNMVRLHFIDLNAPRGIIDATRDDSRGFDAGQLDRLDFLVAAPRGCANSGRWRASRRMPRSPGSARTRWPPRRKSGSISKWPSSWETEDRFFQDMSKYLKETLGVKAPIVGTADHGHSSSAYPLLTSITKLDIVDGHVYWQHPGTREPKAPMVNDPFHSTVVQLSRTAYAGKPYTVSETNHPFPNDWASEGIPIIAAYGSFQDWDAIVMYTFEPKLAPDWKPYVGDPFDISLDPVRMTQMATGALTFLRGDVRPALKTVERTYSREQVIASRRLPRSGQPYFTPGFPLSLPLQHEVRIRSFDGPPTAEFTVADTNPIVSDTKELAWYTSTNEKGLVTVETDRTESLIGFVKANRKVLKNLAADIENDFAAIVLASMDSEPLARSGKMLLTAGSRVANTGLEWNENHSRLTKQGGPPTLIEPVAGTITLRNLQGTTSVTAAALDGAGRPIGDSLPARKSADGWTLSLGEPATTWYVITVERQ